MIALVRSSRAQQSEKIPLLQAQLSPEQHARPALDASLLLLRAAEPAGVAAAPGALPRYGPNALTCPAGQRHAGSGQRLSACWAAEPWADSAVRRCALEQISAQGAAAKM